jgi:hypothetical protein
VDIHYTAGPATSRIYDIAAYQVGPTAQADFPAIAYHLMVDDVGDVHLLNDLNRRVWHNAGWLRNEVAIGICYTGNHEPNAAQKRGLRQAIEWCQQQLGRGLFVRGHKDTYATACPGPTWPGWIGEILP